MKKILLGTLVLIASSLIGQKNYESNLLMVKIKESYKAQFYRQDFGGTKLDLIFSSIGMTSVERAFPHSKSPRNKFHENGIAYTDITLINEIRYSSNDDPKDLISSLMQTGIFEYVEPSYLFETLYKPNDPEIDSLYFMEMLNMFGAWDVSKGDTNVVIGISDTGFDTDHPDLVNSVKYNYNDPIDGIDNDGDGYIDNFRGWDLGTNDNDPQVVSSWHGIYVSSFVGATADNGIQLAGSGFKCKIVPLKIEDASGALTGAYNSIVYAADHGFNVVNCSWGSPNSWSQLGQDICKYATVDKNCLVIAAAGNDDSDNIWYPASFDWVLSVGGTNKESEKWIENDFDGSTYNDYVDVVAPANKLYRINNGGGSIIGGGFGTSFSAPIVSGIAGLIKSEKPHFTAVQVLEQIKATARNIDTIPFNTSYSGKLGKGLVDAQAALSDYSNPGLVFDGATFTDNDDNLFLPGDTVILYGSIINFLTNSSSSTKYRVETSSPYIEFLDSVQPLIAIPYGQTLNTSALPFRFIVRELIPKNENIYFKVFMEDGDYFNWRVVSKTFNEDYSNLNENNINISVGASGKLGYNGVEGDQSMGLGVKYKDAEVSSAYVIGVLASLNLSKTVYSVQGGFETTSSLVSIEDKGADRIIYTHYDDDPMGVNKIGIEVRQKTMAWDDANRKDFILMEMSIKNTSGSDINGMSFGFYADWDISNSAQNNAVFDSTLRTGYVSYPGGVHAGIHIISDSAFQHYAVDNSGAGGSVSIYDGNFTTAEQRTTMIGGNARPSAGLGDVSQTVGVLGLNIPSGDSVTVAFAVVMGDDLATITAASVEADTAYKELNTLQIDVVSSSNASCFDMCDGDVTLSASGGVGNLTYNWFDVPGTPTTNALTNLCASIYHCAISDENGLLDTIQIVITSPDYNPVFVGYDTVICANESINLEAEGLFTSYFWNTMDTTRSLFVNSSGIYIVQATDSLGCVSSDTVFVGVNQIPIISITDTTNSNGAACNGSINGTVTNGTPDYIYSWSDDEKRDSIHAVNLCVGEYTLVVTDMNGCETNQIVEISDIPVFVYTTGLDRLSLFPNPTKGIITIKGLPSSYSIKITDILGKDITDVFENKGKIDFSGLDAGSYFIQITSGTQTKTQKILVRK
jgi:subtilisin family serine protease